MITTETKTVVRIVESIEIMRLWNFGSRKYITLFIDIFVSMRIAPTVIHLHSR